MLAADGPSALILARLLLQLFLPGDNLTERAIYPWLLLAWLGVAAASFAALQFLSAPYGRHLRAGWGPTIHRTAGWIIMESPAPLVFLGCFLLSDRRSAADLTFLALWLLHYAWRAWIYPFRLRGGQLRMPLSIVAMAFCFNLMNGYIQGRGLYALGPEHPTSWLLDPRFLVGVVLFLGGWAVNRQSDAILRALRRPGDTSYHIPFGGAYRWVSCPNYFGELVEWLGWAILTWSPAGLVFFLWSAANLVPRARTHHRWYREQFPEYPRERRALVPFAW